MSAPSRTAAKRLIDIALVLSSLPATLPVGLLTAVSVWTLMGRPVFFRQWRPGLAGTPFRIVKFRTMSCQPGPDSSRLTPIGRLLRSTSVDELPTLLNVLRGEMSLVGPRPLLMQYLERYNPRQARRHDVKPGVTGWAQVNGRNAISWATKLELDVWYVENQSLRLDLEILVRTVWQVIRRVGVSHEGSDTMPEFQKEGRLD